MAVLRKPNSHKKNHKCYRKSNRKINSNFDFSQVLIGFWDEGILLHITDLFTRKNKTQSRPELAKDGRKVEMDNSGS